MAVQLENGAVGTPSLQFTGSPTTGIYTINGLQLNVSIGGVLQSQTSSSGISTANNGFRFLNSSSAAGMRWTSDTLTFSTSGHNNPMEIVGSTAINSNIQLRPGLDNNVSCGSGTNRWTAVFAVNGTIQTSHSSTKTDILELSSDVKIPMGISFKRPGDDKLHYGFLIDEMPEEILYDGLGVETSAVIGILCKKLTDALADISSLKAELTAVKSQLSTPE